MQKDSSINKESRTCGELIQILGYPMAQWDANQDQNRLRGQWSVE